MRIEVRENRYTFYTERSEESWPLPQTRWMDLYLGTDGRLVDAPVAGPGTVCFDAGGTSRPTLGSPTPPLINTALPLRSARYSLSEPPRSRERIRCHSVLAVSTGGADLVDGQGTSWVKTGPARPFRSCVRPVMNEVRSAS